MIEAKVFQSGNSQAIRLPKDYRIDADSVHISKIGNLVVLVPKDDPWKSFIDGVNEAVDFPESILKLKNKTIKLA
jgi:antitoxin VapB